MKISIIIIVFMLISKYTFAQNELPTNSFKGSFYNSCINYKYIEDLQIHDYSGNWDFDGDNVKDSIKFIGEGGVHLFYFLFIKLSSDNKIYKFEYIRTDFPLLLPIDSLNSFDSSMCYYYPIFVVNDFNNDGIQEILLGIDSEGGFPSELKKLGINSNKIIIQYNIKRKKFIFQNYRR